MKQLFEKVFAALFLALVLVACEPVEPEGGSPEKSDKASLVRFAFSAGNNPGMSGNSSAVMANNYYWITVPEGVDRSSLVPTIEVSAGATASVDGQPYTPGTAYDFSGNVQTVRVVSESGTRSVDYKLVVKHGISAIDNKVYAFMRDFNIPGVSISIMKGTEIKYSSGYGFAFQTLEIRTTPDHLFRMASISKQFCTMCIMTLKEEGRLNLDDRVFGEAGILKGLFTNLNSCYEAITVRHLLSHTSAICAGLSDPAFTWSYRMYDNGTPVPTDTLIQRTINAHRSSFTPGAAYDYSNVGFCVLHRIVEVVSGKDYESFLKEDVLAKMGVTDTHIGGYREERRSNECEYYMQNGTDGYANPLRQLAGAAGIITSTNQMMRVLTFMDGDDTVPDIFSEETLQAMYTPYPAYPRYGLGWRLGSSWFPGAHYHGGNIAGTATLWAANTNRHMSGAFVCNSRAYNENSNGDIDDNMYILLSGFMDYFDN